MYGDDRRRMAVNDLFAQTLRLPMAAFFYSLEWMIRAVQSVQDGARAPAATYPPNPAAASQPSQPTQEGCKMDDDQDLSGDDLKFVSYAILFTKRDLEATLEECREEVINYSTNAGSFGGLKIAKFMGKVAAGKVKRPRVWIENKYPDAKGEYGWELPEGDERYVTFVFKVEKRLDRQAADYDRQKVQALQGIHSTLGDIYAKIG